jgi:ankyrin repeat protein
LKRLLESGQDVNLRTNTRETLVSLAILHARPVALTLLLSRRPQDVTEKDLFCCRMIEAATTEDPLIASILANLVAELSFPTVLRREISRPLTYSDAALGPAFVGETIESALSAAVRSQNVRLLRFYHDLCPTVDLDQFHRPDHNTNEEGSYLLNFAAYRHDHATVKTLLRLGALINPKHTWEETALEAGCKLSGRGGRRVVDLLIRVGNFAESGSPDADKLGDLGANSALCRAAYAGCTDTVARLLSAGARVEDPRVAHNCVACAMAAGNDDVVQMLWKAGASLTGLSSLGRPIITDILDIRSQGCGVQDWPRSAWFAFVIRSNGIDCRSESGETAVRTGNTDVPCFSAAGRV